MITPQEALNRLIDQNELFYDEMLYLMRQIMQGEVSPALVAAILVGLRVKVETVSEISAAAQVMREFSAKVPIVQSMHLVDTCGTGGDKAHTFNISTTSAFVTAAAGAKVAKHGGRSVSSSSGSADVLEALGVNLQLSPEKVGQCIDMLGLGFMFAPNHHSAMKHVAPIRKELGVRTLFNILGPLTNPAGADHQVMGVFHRDLVGIQVRVLQQLGSHHVMIVHGMDGLDEITIQDKTLIGELKDGVITEYELDPTDFGFELSPLTSIQVNNIDEAKNMLVSVLQGQSGASRDIVLLNSAAAIYTSGVAANFKDGLEKAAQAIDSGLALSKLESLIDLSQRLNA